MKKIRQLLMLCCLAPASLLAQQKTITGKVSNAQNGEPLAGVSISAGGTANASSTTNADGRYTINAPAAATKIIFTYVGMKTVTEDIKGRSSISIAMTGNEQSLDNVVVVGYGTQKKTTLTGAVSQITSKELVVTKNENVANMLTGKIPGLRMVQRTAEPGAYENSFDVRGYGGSPLVVIDGVPRGGFEKMDPNEIESISVLKDAAAAIYGNRGANGVILITTKKGGARNRFDITYAVNQGWQQFLGMPDAVGPVDYMMLTNEKMKRDFANNFVANTPPAYSYEDILPWMDGTYQGADWIGSAFNTVTPQMQHNLSFSGGSDRVNAFFNVGYMKQSGLLKSEDLDYSRWNLRSNINVKITNNLRAQILISGLMDEKNQPFQDLWTIFKYTWNQIPINQIYANNNPEYLNVMPDNANPVAITDGGKVGTRQRTQKNLQSQINLEYEVPFVKGLKARGMFNYGYNVDDNTDYKKAYNLYSYKADEDKYMVSNVNGPSNLNRAYGTGFQTLSQLALTYDNIFSNKHHVTAIALLEENHTKNDNFYASRNMSLPIDYLFGGDADGQVGNTSPGGVQEVTMRSWVGRATYDFKGKYLLEGTARYDASNKYSPKNGNIWGFFPGVLAGWRISEEPFFKNLVPSKIISNLKLRASYGQLGNDAAAPFQYVSGYNYPTVNPNDNSIWGYIFNGAFIGGAETRGVVNPDITWSTSTTKNIGLDFGLFDGALEGLVELYRRDQTGLPGYRGVTIPGTAGVDIAQENINSDRVQGWELQLTHRNRFRDVGILVSGNVSYAQRQTRSIIQGDFGNEYQEWRNSAINRNRNIWWGVDYGGQFASYDNIYTATTNNGGGNNNIVPGDYYMEDWNEDGVINGDDYHPIATYDLPLINFGLTLGLTYKGFDLNALFTGATGVWVQYDEQYAEPLMYGRSSLTKFLDSWHTVNPDDNVFDPNTQWIQGNYPAMGYNYGLINNSTKAVMDASYIRCKTLELGYNLPQRLVGRAGIKNARLYGNAYNLFTISNLKDSDPEHPGKIPGAGFDYGLGGYKYPLNRTFNIGASITF